MLDLPHFNREGQSHMVDVGPKPTTRRVAVASGTVELKQETLQRIQSGEVQKGNVLELARIAGIMATKRTSDLIPLCHPLRLDSVDIEFEFPSDRSIAIRATVSATERTGVEMEALTAISIAALTIYDMCKSVDREMKVCHIQLEEKSGGKTGTFRRTG